MMIYEFRNKWKIFKKVQKIVLVFIILLTLLLFLRIYTFNSVRVHELQNTVSQFTTITDNSSQSLKTLLLNRFWVATIYDPILALPGADLDKLTKSIRSIADSRNAYTEFYSKSEQNLILEKLHPVDFLESLILTEEARRAFINSPSYRNARKYNTTLIQSLTLQSDYVKGLSIFFNETTQKDVDVAFVAGITSGTTIANRLADMYQQIDAQLENVRSRKKCLYGFKNYCTITLPSVITPTEVSENFDINKALATGDAFKKILHNQAYGYESYSLTDTPSDKLPLVHIPKSLCTNYDYGTYIFTWKNSQIPENSSFWTTNVDELLFHDLKKSISVSNIYPENTEINYLFQAMNPYLCIDNSADVGKIRTAYYIQNMLSVDPLISTIASSSKNSKLLNKLKRIETDILNQKTILYINSIEDYVATAQEITYSKHSDINLSKEEIMRLLNIITLWRSQSGWLESEFGRIDNSAAGNIYIMWISDIPILPLFMVRGYFSSLLLTSNATVFNQSISYLKNRTPLDFKKAGIVTYSNTISKFIPLSKLPAFIKQKDEYYSKYYKQNQ